MSAEKTYAIHPAIGVARLGNLAPDLADPGSWFLGPEVPFETANAGRPYKGADGRMKKQAQRFRIYEFENGRAVREVTLEAADVREIRWTVHLANRKAALDPGSDDPVAVPGVIPPDYTPAKARNEGAEQAGLSRAALAIDPGPRTVSRAAAERGAAGRMQACEGWIAMPSEARRAVYKRVAIGSIASEPETGRLLVFAGDGTSEGVENGGFTDAAGLHDWRNNNGWYDDTADGRVGAVVTFADGREVALDAPEQAAWVICAAPSYAPGFGYFTTLEDLSLDKTLGPPEGPVSFMRDVYPVLRAVSRLGWVNQKGALGHGAGKSGCYLRYGAMERLSDAGEERRALRSAVFGRIRDPGSAFGDRDRELRLMPRVPEEVLALPWKEDFDVSKITPRQYEALRRWAEGDFEADYDPSAEDPAPLEARPVAEQPSALDRGALEGTAGTPLYPGIESWRIMRDGEVYAAPLRFRAEMRPGDMTMGNALPWQADFLDCDDNWWPVQRPTLVIRDGAAAAWAPPWTDAEGEEDYDKMVLNWWKLGMVVAAADGSGYVETERSLDETW